MAYGILWLKDKKFKIKQQSMRNYLNHSDNVPRSGQIPFEPLGATNLFTFRLWFYRRQHLIYIYLIKMFNIPG